MDLAGEQTSCGSAEERERVRTGGAVTVRAPANVVPVTVGSENVYDAGRRERAGAALSGLPA